MFGFLNKHFKIIPKIDLITILSCLYKDLFLQKSHSFLHDSWVPLSKFSLLIMIYFLDQIQVISFHLLILFFVKFILIFMEFYNWAFHSLNQWFCPTYNTCNWRLTSTDNCAFISLFISFFAFVKKLSVRNKLFVVAVQNLCILSL